MNYIDAIAALDQCGQHTINPGLERMQAACERLGHPEQLLKCIHVAGTNGKGSTIAFMESLLKANGSTVGRYTSPHLHDLRERICTNGQWISESDFVHAYTVVSNACADLGLSYFEWLTLIAFVHFHKHSVDIVLLETGLGGRWDATNVVTPLVSVITSIDYDHQRYLGETLKQIAAEKCGILKKDAPAVIAPQNSEAMDVIQHVIAELEIHAQVVPPLSSEIALGLKGDYQRQNAALAVAAVRVSREQPSKSDDDFDVLATTRWPGRLEWTSQDPPILCDVAHNVAGAKTLCEYIKTLQHCGNGEVAILLGVMSDKDALGMVRELSAIANRFYCVSPNISRALPAEQVAKFVRACDKTAIVTTNADMKRTWKGPGILVVTGSFYTVAEFCAAL
ncbi:MAG: hypothetical protein COV45_08795 [Deltaproteobacteria bacterium CG11_big_fil_rev_8_21_14_0_20_47_16]|nr:MAG: hypothetical protein COV45_08795 [Deltaproteobacteria bacterium CG11_big_fil_rev_8_21_14_0_20_47_16]